MAIPQGVTRRSFLGGAAAALLGAPAVLAACGGGGAATGQRRSRMRVGVNGDVTTFNPFLLNRDNYIFTANIYDTLLRYDRDLKPQARMAEKWSIAADSASIDLTLRSGLTFQSGATVRAADVVKNFELAADKATGYNVYPFAAYIAQVVPVSDSQVRVRFVQPLPAQAITDIVATMAIVDPAAMPSIQNRGVGAGPFSFGSWTPRSKLVYNKFAHFWSHAIPASNGIDWQIFSDDDALVQSLQSGALDMAAYIPAKSASQLKGKFDLVISSPAAQAYDVRLNPKQAPFDRKGVRQGLQYAIDRKAIVQDILYGFSKPTVVPFGETSAAFDPSAAARYPFDLSRAKQAFASAGAAGWSADMMVTNTYSETVQMAQLLQSDLRKIGVNLKLDVVDLAEYNQKLVAGDFTCTWSFSGVANKYPSWISLSGAYSPTDNPLWGSDVPPAYASAMQAVSSALTADQQKTAFARLRQALLDESWVINVAYNASLSAMAKGAGGVGYTVDDWLMLENASVGVSSGT